MLEKGAVLQEVRIFSANPLKPKACYSLLSRILWVMMHGESINKKEATDVFFGVTKLFQSKDVRAFDDCTPFVVLFTPVWSLCGSFKLVCAFLTSVGHFCF